MFMKEKMELSMPIDEVSKGLGFYGLLSGSLNCLCKT